MIFNVCRFCKEDLCRADAAPDHGLKYGPRHYAHVRCLAKAFTPDALTAKLKKVPLWQIKQVPYFLVEELGLLDVWKSVLGHDHEPQLGDIQAAIEKFPALFGLRAFPGKIFRISRIHSYISENRVILYTEVRDADGVRFWSFAKGTAAELRPEIVEVPA